MIHKYYEVICDYCGITMNHYPDKKPTNYLLQHDGFTVTKTKHFCSQQCYANWNHDLLEQRYLNIHPDGKTTSLMDFNVQVIKTQRYCYINAISDKTGDRIGKLCIDLESEDYNRYKTNKHIAKIILVSTNQSVCGNGIATALLNKAIELFNDYTLYLNVVPLPRTNENPKYISKLGLMNFYSKFGFKRYDKDICVTTMIR